MAVAVIQPTRRIPSRKPRCSKATRRPKARPIRSQKRSEWCKPRPTARQYGFNAISLVPGNLYGPFDNFDLHSSHVIPALIRKFLVAKETNAPEVAAWGSGKPVRDFVYVTDACEAILLAAETYNGADLINISSGVAVTIKELTETIAELAGYRGKVVWDTTKPDGQMMKGFDVTRMRQLLGYECRTSLRDGLRMTINWVLANRGAIRLP